MKQFKKICLAFLIFLLVFYPPLLLLKKINIAAPFQYFAADVFYYLAVADNSIDMPYFTFDGTRPTNGFHPFWQYYLTFVFKLFDSFSDQSNQIFFAFVSSIVLTAFGTALFGLAVFRLTHRFALSLLAAVPGIYYLLFSRIIPHYGSTWSFINGMESPSSIFFFGLLLYLIFSPDQTLKFNPKRVVVLSALLTAVVLCRLDDIFIFGPFFVYICFLPDKTSRFKLLLAFIFPPVSLIGMYLLYNLSYSGMLLPVSGMVKGGSIELISNIKALLLAFCPLTFFSETWTHAWKHGTWRILQLVVPLIAASIWLSGEVIRRRGRIFFRAGNHRDAISLLCGYVILKGCYNIFAVPLWQQGHWYFPLNIMIFNLLGAWFISRHLRNTPSKRLAAALTAIAILWIILLANSFTSLKLTSGYNLAYFNFWKGRKELNQKLKRVIPGEGLLSFDDGIICYALGQPVMSGLGYCLDKEAFQAFRKGRLLDIAYRRGFNNLTSYYYLQLPEKPPISGRLLKRKLASCFFLSGQKLENWRFSIAWRPEKATWAIVKFEPEDK